MANGIAVGGFAQGLSQGLNSDLNMAMQLDKNKREQESFELDKKVKQNQIDEMERKRLMNEQIARDLKALESNAAGGVTGGQATDEFGTAIGGLKYSSPAQAKASGLSFAPGTTTEAPAMSEFQKSAATIDIFKKARIDHNFMDEDSWSKSQAATKLLKKEGISEAFETFLSTGDSDAGIRTFNEARGGKIKAPPGSFMKRMVDPETGVVDVGVYIPGKDGKPELYTTMNQYLLMTNSDAIVKHYTEMKKSKFEQGEATNRTVIDNKGRIMAAQIGADSKDGAKVDPRKKRVDDIVFGVGKSVVSNPMNALKGEAYVADLEKVAAKAMQLLTSGQFTDEAAAVAAARKELSTKK